MLASVLVSCHGVVKRWRSCHVAMLKFTATTVKQLHRKWPMWQHLQVSPFLQKEG